MKKLIYILIVLLTCGNSLNVSAQNLNAVSQATCYNTSNSYSFAYNGNSYKLIKEAKTWPAAAACAASDGGYLAEITDLAEQTAVYNGIVASGVVSNYSPVSDGGNASYIWIGASDSIFEGKWYWDGNNDGITFHPQFWQGQGAAGAGTGSVTNSQYNNWGGTSTSMIQEPDDFGSNQDYAAIALGTWPYGIAGEWNDLSGTNAIYYLIEYNGLPTSVNEKIKSQDLSIFFDRSSNTLKLEKTEEQFKISIIDLQGKIVFEISSSEIQNSSVDLNKLNNGVYLVKYLSATGNLNCKKIIK